MPRRSEGCRDLVTKGPSQGSLCALKVRPFDTPVEVSLIPIDTEHTTGSDDSRKNKKKN